MTLADYLAVTEVALETIGDTYAPHVDPTNWRLANESDWLLSKNGLRYRFRDYRRSAPNLVVSTDAATTWPLLNRPDSVQRG